MPNPEEHVNVRERQQRMYFKRDAARDAPRATRERVFAPYARRLATRSTGAAPHAATC
jgi:hypothetical protein